MSEQLWSEEMTQEETDALIEKAAIAIQSRGLGMPAVLLLESHKPLSFIGSQAAISFSPFLVPLFGFDNVNNYSRLFSKRENVERLLERLDSKPKLPSGDNREG